MNDELLRSAVATMDRELAQATEPAAGGTAPRSELVGAWASVVKALDLQPTVKMRECPTCKRPGMLSATRCGYCWAALTAIHA